MSAGHGFRKPCHAAPAASRSGCRRPPSPSFAAHPSAAAGSSDERRAERRQDAFEFLRREAPFGDARRRGEDDDIDQVPGIRQPGLSQRPTDTLPYRPAARIACRNASHR